MNKKQRISLSAIIPGPTEAIYEAWLDASQHAAFTGDEVRIEPFVGGTFNILNGYITGRILHLDPPKRIIQAWRSADFPPNSPASEVEIGLEKKGNDTLFQLYHSGIPDEVAIDFKQWWLENYIDPMKLYFGTLVQGTRNE